jgi:hypothetical protein
MVHVFTCNGTGGSACSILCDAEGMTAVEMQSVARDHGHESGCVSGRPGDWDRCDGTGLRLAPELTSRCVIHANIREMSA